MDKLCIPIANEVENKNYASYFGDAKCPWEAHFFPDLRALLELSKNN